MKHYNISQRKIIKVADVGNAFDVSPYDEILLDTARPGWKSDSEIVNSIYSKVNDSKNWEMVYNEKTVFLWKKL